MTEFERAQANPYDVIRLFPNLLQDQSKSLSDSFDTAVPSVAMPQLEDKDLENALIALILIAKYKSIFLWTNLRLRCIVIIYHNRSNCVVVNVRSKLGVT